MYEILSELMITFGHDFLICCGPLNEEKFGYAIMPNTSKQSMLYHHQ
jgi:hypothetical protein